MRPASLPATLAVVPAVLAARQTSDLDPASPQRLHSPPRATRWPLCPTGMDV
jgi:hypothetical protein